MKNSLFSDVLDMDDYRPGNNMGSRCNLVVVDIFSKYYWCIHLKSKTTQTMKDEFQRVT